MDKSVYVPVIGTMAILVALSVFALVRMPAGVSIPMQWNLSGNPTWFAPKHLGVWFAPLLALVVLGMSGVARRSATEAAAGSPWTLYIIGAAFIGVHAFHLWSAAKHVAA